MTTAIRHGARAWSAAGAATRPTTGVLYVSTQHDRYVEEAFLSADSVRRRCPQIPITLFTDRPGHPLCGLGCFDEVVTVRCDEAAPSRWAAGVLTKVHCLAKTPYDRTLFLDTDTLLRSSRLAALFDLLECHDVAMAEASIYDSYSRQHYGRPMFNSGVVLYRRNATTDAWLDRWAETTLAYARLALDEWATPPPVVSHVADREVRQRLLCNDQISLVELLSPECNRCSVRLTILDYSWNYRAHPSADRTRVSPNVIHYPRRPARNHVSALHAAVRRHHGSQV